MVSANATKELQNVLPNGNPFPHHNLYYIYRAVGLRRASTVCEHPTYLNTLPIVVNVTKNRPVTTATFLTVATFSTFRTLPLPLPPQNATVNLKNLATEGSPLGRSFGGSLPQICCKHRSKPIQIVQFMKNAKVLGFDSLNLRICGGLSGKVRNLPQVINRK